MYILLSPGADANAVKRALVAHGQWVKSCEGGFEIEPHSAKVSPDILQSISGVTRVIAHKSPHPLLDAHSPVVDVGGLKIGHGQTPVLMSGPCAVESEARIMRIAEQLAPRGASVLRGGAYKPRTSPYAFQGHGEVALRWMRRAADTFKLKMVTEVMGETDVPVVAEYADLLQIGSRNMSNYALLKAVGKSGRPVLLKRSMSATVSEWMQAGEYLLVHGSSGVLFCERGIVGFDEQTRNLLDLGAVALLAHAYHVAVIVDPSHATGRRDLVLPLAHAALSAGAAGVMIETHDDPGDALSDGPQALRPEQLDAMTHIFAPSRRS
jgi:3-deoxy-7-phosphoheptulonate synthase